jgi:hypothetical protein
MYDEIMLIFAVSNDFRPMNKKNTHSSHAGRVDENER